MEHHASENVNRDKVTLEELENRIEIARAYLASCELCPRRCGVDRTSGQAGFCGILDKPVISSHGAHFGEEPPLVGVYGSGTIFMTGCNLGCTFCQNYEISHLMEGEETTVEALSEVMCELQYSGCHNVNFVTPSHQTPQILEALLLARRKGLTIPVVYNCGGYETLRILELLDGVVDIYMPDAKYTNSEVARKFSGVADYPAVMKEALAEMHRQVGDLIISMDGIAVRGLLVRHLVLPDGLAGTEDFVNFLAERISKDTYVNIMGQYRPCFRAHEYPPLDRRVRYDEVDNARTIARKAGLHRGF
jgi:putative pyruvate formate lyase activating enzyme